jgi:proteasome lid subunit RPN8/RPN11
MSLEVILEQNAFLNTVIAGLETYERECFGYYLGKKTKSEYILTAGIPCQLAKRTRTSVDYGTKLKGIVESFNTTDLYMIGDFHSHPEGIPEYSDHDLLDMDQNKNLVYVIISLYKAGLKYPIKNWKTNNKMLTGTMDHDKKRYFCEIAAYCYYNKQFTLTPVVSEFAYKLKS